MDTNQAITILEGRNAILTAEVSAKQLEIEANTLSVSQLKATLQTQLSSLTDDQLNTFPAVVSLKDQVTTLTAEKADQVKKIDELTTRAVTAESAPTDAQTEITTLKTPVPTPVEPLPTPVESVTPPADQPTP